MMLLTVLTLCLAFAWGDYNSNNNVQFRSHRRPFPEPERPILSTTTEQPDQQPLIPELAVLDKEKVLEFANRWCKFVDAKDIDSVQNMYAEDLVFIKSGSDHVLGKKDFQELMVGIINNSKVPCTSKILFISGDYYFPYFWGQYYSKDSNGKLEPAVIYSDVIRLKEDGEYEIVLVNIFVMDNHNKDQGESNGYGQIQAQRMEQPKYQISQPLPHFIPVAKVQKTEHIPQQLNDYGLIPQQTKKDEKAPQKTNDNDQASEQTNINDQAPQQSVQETQQSYSYGQ